MNPHSRDVNFVGEFWTASQIDEMRYLAIAEHKHYQTLYEITNHTPSREFYRLMVELLDAAIPQIHAKV